MLALNTLEIFLLLPQGAITRRSSSEAWSVGGCINATITMVYIPHQFLDILPLPLYYIATLNTHMGQRKKINAIKSAKRKVQLLKIAHNRIKKAAKAPTAGEKLHALMHGRKEVA
jgi:hypothetical protein